MRLCSNATCAYRIWLYISWPTTIFQAVQYLPVVQKKNLVCKTLQEILIVSRIPAGEKIHVTNSCFQNLKSITVYYFLIKSCWIFITDIVFTQKYFY